MEKSKKPGTSLQAGHCGHVLPLPEEAHADVVPQLCGVGSLYRRHAILDERHVHVLVVLNDRARCQDGLRALRVVCQRVAEVLECLGVVAELEEEQSHSGEELRVLRTGFQRFHVSIQSVFLAANESEYASHL